MRKWFTISFLKTVKEKLKFMATIYLAMDDG